MRARVARTTGNLLLEQNGETVAVVDLYTPKVLYKNKRFLHIADYVILRQARYYGPRV
jgi:hypothetical protein